jgi:hypothetical protein
MPGAACVRHLLCFSNALNHTIASDFEFERSKSMSAVLQINLAMIDRSGPSTISNRHSRPHNVNLSEPAAMVYWCRHFDTAPELLLDAVKKVGTNPAIVRLQLRKR